MDADTKDSINCWYLYSRNIKLLNNVLKCNKPDGL